MKRSRAGHKLVGALVGVLLLAQAAGPAQAAAPLPARYTRHFKSGVVHYRAGRYDAALKEFLAAAMARQRVNVVLNIAQCHRLLDHPDEAIKFYRSYLKQWQRENPGKRSPFHDEVQRHIRTLSARKRTDKPAARPALKQPRGDGEAASRPLKLVPGGERAARPRPTSEPIYRKWWFWTAIGVVVVGTVTATAVALQPDQVDPVTGTLGQGPYPLP